MHLPPLLMLGAFQCSIYLFSGRATGWHLAIDWPSLDLPAQIVYNVRIFCLSKLRTPH